MNSIEVFDKSVEQTVTQSVEKTQCEFVSKAGVRCFRMIEGQMCNLHKKQSDKSSVFDTNLGMQCTRVSKTNKRCMLPCVEGTELCKMCTSQTRSHVDTIEKKSVDLSQCSYKTKAGVQCSLRCKHGDMCDMHNNQIKGIKSDGRVTEKFFEDDVKSKISHLTEQMMKIGNISPEMTLIMSVMTMLASKVEENPPERRSRTPVREHSHSRAPSSDPRRSREQVHSTEHRVQRRPREHSRSRAPSSDSRRPRPYTPVRERREIPEEQKCIHINRRTETRCHKYRCKDSEMCAMHLRQCGATLTQSDVTEKPNFTADEVPEF